jgi:hypothetical protein
VPIDLDSAGIGPLPRVSWPQKHRLQHTCRAWLRESETLPCDWLHAIIIGPLPPTARLIHGPTVRRTRSVFEFDGGTGRWWSQGGGRVALGVLSESWAEDVQLLDPPPLEANGVPPALQLFRARIRISLDPPLCREWWIPWAPGSTSRPSSCACSRSSSSSPLGSSSTSRPSSSVLKWSMNVVRLEPPICP